MVEICGFGEAAEALAKVAVFEEACARLMADSDEWRTYHEDRALLAWRHFAELSALPSAPAQRKPPALAELERLIAARLYGERRT